MIRTISGVVDFIDDTAVIMNVHGVGFRVAIPARAHGSFEIGKEAMLHTHLVVKEDALDLYGFRTKEELDLFKLLISVSGVGPKSALAVLDVGDLKDLTAAITQSRPDLLTHAAGIGRKTAERIILDLKGKVAISGADQNVARMDTDTDLVETLMSLGYRRDEARGALEYVHKDITNIEARLKAALGFLAQRKRS